MLGRKLFGGSLLGGTLGALVGVFLFGLFAAGCGDGDKVPQTLVGLGDASPGDVVSLRDAGDGFVEWVVREDGHVMSLDIDDDDAEPTRVAEVDVAIDGQQWGLLSSIVMDDGRRFASWTSATSGDDADLVVGELIDGDTRIVWNAGAAGTGAIGGVLVESDGRLLLGLGRNVAWTDGRVDDGAILSLDPDGPADQEPEVISEGYTNPWAFATIGSNTSPEIWVSDNAAGPDPDDPDVDDVERTGRADLIDRSAMERSNLPGRAPAVMLELADGRIGICGFLDNELISYGVIDTDAGSRSGLERGDTVMPCNTAAVVLANGTIVTAATSDAGETLQILRS